MFRMQVKVKQCDQCEAVRINGVFCHETGCPNTHSKYIDGEWVRMRTCRECGFELPNDEPCCQEDIL